jgi:hypothetical protein
MTRTRPPALAVDSAANAFTSSPTRPTRRQPGVVLLGDLPRDDRSVRQKWSSSVWIAATACPEDRDTDGTDS